MEQSRQSSQAASEWIRQTRRPWTSSSKTFPQNQQVTSTESVFGRLRSNALSMKQKLSQAKRNISVKTADLEKQKEANEIMRNRINEVRACIAKLNAEISQKNQSLEEFKRNSEAFHELLDSARMTFQKNDLRLEGVEKCVRRLQTNLSSIENALNCANVQLKDAKVKLAEEFTLLEFSNKSLLQLYSVKLDIESFNGMIVGGIQEMSIAFESMANDVTMLKEMHITAKNSNMNALGVCSHEFPFLKLSARRLSVLTDAIAVLHGRLQYFRDCHNELMRCYGNILDFEESYALKCNSLKEMESTLNFFPGVQGENESLYSDITELNESIRGQAKRLGSCQKALSSCIDEAMKELSLINTRASDCFELSHRLKELEYYKEKKCSYIWNKIKKLECDISNMLSSVQDVSVELKKSEDRRDLLKHLLSTHNNVQLQLMGEIMATIKLIEQYNVNQNEDSQQVLSQISELTKKLQKNSLKEELTWCFRYNEKVAKIKEIQIATLRSNLISFQQKKTRISRLSQDLTEQNNELLRLILDCKHASPILSEEIKEYDAMAKQERISYESDLGRLEKAFEKKLNDLQTKKIVNQFEKEFYRTMQLQEIELSRKVKQLECIKLQQESEKKQSSDENDVRSQLKHAKPDLAKSELNGGQECPQIRLDGNNEELENESLKQLRKATPIAVHLEPEKMKAVKAIYKKNEVNSGRFRRAKFSEINQNQPTSHNICKEVSISDKQISTAGARHRRQGIQQGKIGNKPTSKPNHLDIDPFAFA